MMIVPSFRHQLLQGCKAIARIKNPDEAKSRKKYSTLTPSPEKAMIDYGIIPEIIPVGPQQTLKLFFDSYMTANLGNVLTPTQVKHKPDVKLDGIDNSRLYTLCAIDMDCPSAAKPSFREWHHWLVGNIPGVYMAKGETLADYIGAAPMKGTGLHRYVYLLYKQKCKMRFTEPRLPNNSDIGRSRFCIRKFAKKYMLGNPIAGNFFQAEWDDYVPLLEDKVGGPLT